MKRVSSTWDTWNSNLKVVFLLHSFMGPTVFKIETRGCCILMLDLARQMGQHDTNTINDQVLYLHLEILKHVVPSNMTVARRLESVLWTLNLFVTFSRQPALSRVCIFLEIITSKFSWHFTGDIENFVQILILLNATKIVEIWTKLKAQKLQTTFSKGYFMIINFRILLLKLGLRINAASYFNDQRRPLFVLLLSCFVGHSVFMFKVLINTSFFIYFY